MENGLNLSSQFILPNSDKFDCVTCGLISDIDMDGRNEILLGSYGQVGYLFKSHISFIFFTVVKKKSSI